MSKDPICSEVFNEPALHPVLYPEEGRVGFCLLLENEMAGELSVLTGAWQLPHSCSGAGGRRGCWLTPRRGKPICVCTLGAASGVGRRPSAFPVPPDPRGARLWHCAL